MSTRANGLVALLLLSAAGPAHASFDTSATFDANELRCAISNFGPIASDGATQVGMEWPRGSGRSLIHAGGLWLLSNTNGITHSAMADYGSEYTGGLTDTKGNATDPFGGNTNYRVFKISRADLQHPGLDFLNWPIDQGAPVDAGHPRLIGDQTLYAVFNDGFAINHKLTDGSALPLKAEVHQTVFGYSRDPSLARVVFVFYEIQNHSGALWPEFYAGLWLDPDIGDGDDNFAGADTALRAVYAYDHEPLDGASPSAAFGVCVLADTLLGRQSQGVSALTSWRADEDPVSAEEAQHLVRGLDAKGDSLLCEASPTPFLYSGDPVQGTGCLDGTAADKRLLVSVGPYGVKAGGAVRFVVAFAVGDRLGAVSVKDNVAALRVAFGAAREAWRDSFSQVMPAPAQASLGAAFANPARDFSHLDFTMPEGVVAQEIQVYDMRGRIVWKEATPDAHAGTVRLHWQGQSLSGVPAGPGVYFFRVVTSAGAFTQKFVRVR